MRTFHEVSETLLEFFEAAAGGPAGSSAAPGTATAAEPGSVATAAAAAASDPEEEPVQVPAVLLLGAARVLGRYFAEAPQVRAALHCVVWLAVLPCVSALTPCCSAWHLSSTVSRAVTAACAVWEN